MHSAFTEVEWMTIFFFVGLFIVVHGVESTGALALLADKLLALTGGDLGATAMVILWSSAVPRRWSTTSPSSPPSSR